MIRAIEALFMLLQLAPIFELSMGSNPLRDGFEPPTQYEQTEEPESAASSSWT